MKRDSLRNLIGIIFLTIFLVKLSCAVAPIIAQTLSDKKISSVLLEAEMENNAKEGETTKDFSVKEWTQALSDFIFELPLKLLYTSNKVEENSLHVQSFYLTVPTPPPNS